MSFILQGRKHMEPRAQHTSSLPLCDFVEPCTVSESRFPHLPRRMMGYATEAPQSYCRN